MPCEIFPHTVTDMFMGGSLPICRRGQYNWTAVWRGTSRRRLINSVLDLLSEHATVYGQRILSSLSAHWNVLTLPPSSPGASDIIGTIIIIICIRTVPRRWLRVHGVSSDHPCSRMSAANRLATPAYRECPSISDISTIIIIFLVVVAQSHRHG